MSWQDLGFMMIYGCSSLQIWQFGMYWIYVDPILCWHQ
jgi:hypothetical protein